MSQNASPRPGDVYLLFDGTSSFVEIPSNPAYSVSTTDELTVSGWIRPDVLEFSRDEESGYVHWMGKGERSGPTGDREWACRMYSLTTTDYPPRPNRISFYVFNLEGRLGVGSYAQEPVSVTPPQWIHIVGVADRGCTHFFRNGVFTDCDIYRPDQAAHCRAHDRSGPCETGNAVIVPQAGTAPLRIGTRDRKSYFRGGITRVRIWGRALGDDEVAGLYAMDAVPSDRLVAEYLLNADTGIQALDTAMGNRGIITNASWATQA